MYHDKNLAVEYKGEDVGLIPSALLTQQDCWENLEKIKEFQIKRLELFDKIREEESLIVLKILAEMATAIEFELQDLWKFGRSEKFHRFWDMPKCQCPKMDNDDAYPTGYYVISGGCPLHGQDIGK